MTIILTSSTNISVCDANRTAVFGRILGCAILLVSGPGSASFSISFTHEDMTTKSSSQSKGRAVTSELLRVTLTSESIYHKTDAEARGTCGHFMTKT